MPDFANNVSNSIPGSIVDIIPPAAPPPAVPPYGWMISVGVLLLALVLAWLLRKRYQTRQQRRALAQIHATAQRLQAGQLDARRALFAAHAALAQVYPLAAVQQRRVLANKPAQAHNSEWAAFVNNLDQARFALSAPSAEVAHTLVSGAQHWIRRAPC